MPARTTECPDRNRRYRAVLDVENSPTITPGEPRIALAAAVAVGVVGVRPCLADRVAVARADFVGAGADAAASVTGAARQAGSVPGPV